MAMSVVYATINGQIVSENRGGVISYYAPDNLGSTVALLDATGTVTDTFTYWPYGEIQSHVGSSVTPFTFCGTLGYYTDVLGSQIYVRARYLWQALTRWLTQDPLWPRDYAYVYASSNPVAYSDPSGLATCEQVRDDCLKRADHKRNTCLKDATDDYASAIQLCLLKSGIEQLECFLSAQANYDAHVAWCLAKTHPRYGLCQAQYFECQHGRDIANGLACITIAAGATYCIYRGAKAIGGFLTLPETCGASWVLILSP